MKIVTLGDPSTGLSVAGRLINNDTQIVVVIKDGIQTIIKIIEVANNTIGEVIEKGSQLYNELAKFFDVAFKRMPLVIEFDGLKYHFTVQPGRGKIDTVVMYQTAEGEHKVLLESKGKTGLSARDKMRKSLRELGWF